MNRAFSLAILLFLSMIIVFFDSSGTPAQMAPDEVEFARLAASLGRKSFTVYSSEATGHPTLYFYLILISFKIFGVSLFALRFPAALFGMLNGVIFYLIAEEIFGIKKFGRYVNLPFISALIFITLRWHFNFARFSFEATFLLFLELISTFFIFHYLKEKKNLALFVSGLFAGLAFNSYTPRRIFFLVPLLSFWLFGRKLKAALIVQNLKKTAKLIIFIIPFILFAAPLALTLSKVEDYRVSEEFIFNASDLTLQEKYRGVIANAVNNINMLFYRGDMNGRHNYPGKPALNPILSFLLLAGFAKVYLRKKNIYDKFFLIYFAISLLPTIFTHPSGNPNMLRTFTLIPVVVYFITNGFIYLELLLNKLFLKRYTIMVLMCIIAVSSLYELRTYFIHQSREMKYTFEIRKSFEWLKKNNFILTPEAYQY